MKPLVSILIPAYNAAEWIEETLRSAVAQTWKHKEIIVVDDGSSDATAQVTRQFESAGVQVFRQVNQGAAAARNRAFALSKGDYIQWLDADDLLSPDKISCQMEVAERLNDPNLLFSCGWGQFLYRSERARFVPTALWCDLSPAEFLLRKLKCNLHMQTATWLASRQLTAAAGLWDTRLLGDDDGEYFCRVLMKSSGVRFVSGARVYYRASGTGSLSYIGASTKKLEAHWQSMQKHIRSLLSLEDSPRSRAACARYLQNWLIHFYPEHTQLLSEMRALAEELGFPLRMPQLPAKYSWMTGILGWKMTKYFHRTLPALRWSVSRFFDKMRHLLAGMPAKLAH